MKQVTSGCLKEAVLLPGQGPRPSWKGAREAGKGGPRGEEVAGDGVWMGLPEQRGSKSTIHQQMNLCLSLGPLITYRKNKA